MDGETDAGVTNTRTLLHSIPPLAEIAIAVEQPVAVLLANGPGFSVLFATRISARPDDGAVFVQDCTQYRIRKDGSRTIRYYTEVMFGFDKEKTLFFASPDGGASLFSQPSRDPYAVLELSRKEAENISGYIKIRSDDALFDLLRIRFGNLPGFYTPNSNELHAPDDYATAKSEYSNDQRFTN